MKKPGALFQRNDCLSNPFKSVDDPWRGRKDDPIVVTSRGSFS